jgi:hypothetical protein
MSSTTASFTFPHDELTVIEGKPTNTSLQLLQQQLYTNTRSVPSPQGGGNNSHLALLMTDTMYLARAGVAFDVPSHPGAAPVHANGATAAQIAETIRLFNQKLAKHTLYHCVAQILKAVQSTYLRELDDADYGYADATPEAMLMLLKDNYGVLTPEALKANRASLSTPWNPDAPIENLWQHIIEIQRIAQAGNALITDVAGITLTLAMFEKSGLLSTTTQAWRVKPTLNWTWALFKTDFTLVANTKRIRQTTAAAAGYYHGANGATAIITPGKAPPAPEIAAAATTAPANVTPFVSINGGKM